MCAYFVELIIAESVLRITDNLAKSLKSPKLFAADGRDLANKEVLVLEHTRDDSAFSTHYDAAIRRKEALGKHIQDTVHCFNFFKHIAWYSFSSIYELSISAYLFLRDNTAPCTMAVVNYHLSRVKYFVAGLDEPVLPREKTRPERYAEGAGSDYFPSSPAEMYKVLFYELLDRARVAIEERFNQPDYDVFVEMEQV